jgi:acyl transferase domain-containing protein/NADPH:quinone reductase-like Zn-dependent oxidoreductase
MLKHARAGVFIACYNNDYSRLLYDDIDAIDLRGLTGIAQCIVANRISHFLDLRGPSVTLDTGCSASLVAVHLACQSLRSGENDFVLAGGVSLMLTPESMVGMSKLGLMAPDGRCKTFDARADGMGRGEGCGVVALKRLADALAHGDRVHAVIRGSAINQDGRSTVLTAPNGLAQEALVREALNNAAIGPERVVYVEAHGTGTALGDPIEVGALTAALAARNAPPCYVGSVKANIGHLEAAAGVIGLIKTVLVLREGEIPPQPAFDAPNPHLDLLDSRLKIATASAVVPRSPTPCAAVSSFGIGGTNAHVVLEQALELAAPRPAAQGAVWMLPLSAKTADGLRALGKAWLELLTDPASPPINDLCHTAAQRRTHFTVRLAATGRSPSELRSSLEAALKNTTFSTDAERPRVGFVYSGQGPQWWAMGRELCVHEPVFAASLARCDQAIKASAGWSVLEELSRDERSTRLSETEIVQPVLFALQTALTALWQSWGIIPEAVVGHSVGEIAAFHAAGALSLEEAARVVVLRGRAMHAAKGCGRMASAAITESEARALAQTFDGRLDVAAVNAPGAVVLSGESSALEAAIARLAERGVEARALPVDYAFHSGQMAPLAERFERDLGELNWRAPDRAIFSTLSGAVVPQRGFTAADLASGIRSPVRFADAVKAIAAGGVDAFIEIGPHPVLSSAIAQTLDAHPPRVLAASLRRERGERATMREACAQLYAAGYDPDWRAVQPGEGAVATLPVYPWRRQRYWLRRSARATTDVAKAQWFGAPIPLAGQDATAFSLDPAAIGDWLADHRIFGRSVTPGAVMMQAMASAARIALGRDVSLKEFEIAAPLLLPEDPANTCWQILVSDHVRPRVSLQEGVRAAMLAPFSWHVIAEAKVGAPDWAEAWDPIAGEPLDIAAAYARVAAVGATFGPTFRLLSDVVVGAHESAGWAEMPAGATSAGMHPALIDAGLQLANFASGEDDASYVPVAADAVEISTLSPRRVRVKARVTARTQRSITADVVVETEAGQVAASLTGVQLARATADNFQKDDAAESYVTDWTPASLASSAAGPPRRWAVLSSSLASVSDLVAVAAARGAQAATIASSDEAADGATIILFADAVGDAAGLAAFINSTSNAQLTIVTRGAVATRANEAADSAGAALWGLASVAALERPELELRLLDLDPNTSVQGENVLAALEASSEARLALRGGTLLAPRLRRLARSGRYGAQRVTQTGEGLDAVAWASFTAQAPGPGEVRIKVAAAGVNFRDALMAIGMYPGAPVPLGVECAGTVEAVGPGVQGFEVGARVFGFAPASQATHALARADMISLTPDALSDTTAAALPSAYLTADVGLRRLAKMQPGDRVLIHAATGGVGLAAVALAQRAGAEIHATAGSPAKRALLKQMGIAHVYDSRSLDYADQILEATDGEGVRIALNSLTGPFVGATLRALAPKGILLELGKRDIWSEEQVSAVRPDVQYHVYDTGRLLETDPALFNTFARDLLPAICAGDLPVLQTRVWPMSRASEAYTWMAQARHTGKIVLTPPAEEPRIRADATYLITGGLGGLGLFSADWLARHGARRLLLVGRTAPNATAQAKIAELAARLASVRVAIADVADIDAMRALIDEASAEQAPIRGVIHAAGVAPDRTLARATPENFAEARRGKVEGARVLRAVTESQELDFLLLYSSAGGAFGAPGQGAYVAANAELDAYATLWRREGVRATSVAWGPWAGAGMFAASPTHVQLDTTSRGLAALSAPRAFAALETLMARDLACGIVADVDWNRFLARVPVGLELSMFASFAQREQTQTAAGNEIARLMALPNAQRRAALETLVRDRVRTAIGLAADHDLPLDAPLRESGLDSLMAVELRNGLARFGGVPLPATLAFDHPNIDALVTKLASVWGLETMPVEDQGVMSADIETLSEAEAEAELEEELRSLAAARLIEKRTP